MSYRIPDDTQIGHVHLKVADLARAEAFYGDVLGFELRQRYGDQAAFMAAGGYHHHIGLNIWQSAGGRRRPRAPPASSTSPSSTRPGPTSGARSAPARERRPPGWGSDHGVSEALYLHDPDGNGIELYWDRPQAEWPTAADGSLLTVTVRSTCPACWRGRRPGLEGPAGQLVETLAAGQVEVDRRDGDPALGDGVEVGAGLVVVGRIVAVDVVRRRPLSSDSSSSRSR